MRAAAALLAFLAGLPAFAGPVTLLSRADPARPSATAGGAGRVAGVSSDGRYVLFLTNASNLLPGVDDVNAGEDLFLHDRVAGATVLVSHTALDPDTTADHITLDAALSADGRFAAFRSVATDLVAGQSDSPVTPDVFLWSRETGNTVLVSQASGFPLVATGLCWEPLSLSADGSKVVFLSSAPNLVPGQVDDDFSSDVFLYEAAGTTLVSRTSAAAAAAAGGNTWGAAISADGQWIAYGSTGNDIVAGQVDGESSYDVFLFSRATSQNALVSHSAVSAAATANGFSGRPEISADGGRVAFLSGATNLVAGQSDINGEADVFLYDRATNASVLASRTAGSATTAGNRYVEDLSLSADGRFVAFSSTSSDLVAGDVNLRSDVFLYDRNSGAATLVSRASASAAPSNGTSDAPRITADGAFVLFRSDGSNLVSGQVDPAGNHDLFLWTRATGTTSLVTHEAGSPATSGRGISGSSFRISGDGAWIALASRSESLVSGVDDLNANDDVFLHQRSTGAHTLVTARGGAVSAAAGGSVSSWTATALSNDGRYTAFTSEAPNVVPGVTDGNNASDVFLHDRVTGAVTLVSRAAGSAETAADALSWNPLVTSGGAAVLFESAASNLVPGQAAGAERQLYRWDRATGQTVLVTRSAASPLVPGNGGIWGSGYYTASKDGRWIAFNDYGSNLVAGMFDANGGGDVFLHDAATGATTLVSHASSSPTQTANGISGALAISADGRWLAFQSDASDLVAGQTGSGIFLYDRIAGTTVRASPSDDTWSLAMSADGQRLAFFSSATNLVPGQVDANGSTDVFLWDRATGTTRLVSRAAGSSATAGNGLSHLGPGPSQAPVISADGRWLAFYSNASNLVAGQSEGNASGDIFLFDAVAGTSVVASRSAVSPVWTGDRSSSDPALSADGRFVAFLSQARNLVPGQLNRHDGPDSFVFDREAGAVSRISHVPGSAAVGGLLWADTYEVPRLSADGAWIAFTSRSPDLVAGDHDGAADALLHANPLPGRDFFTVTPCRVLDPQTLASGIEKTVTVVGACGIPAAARAIAVNVTVVEPSDRGRLTLHPGDLAAPLTSTINFAAGETRANNALLALALDGTGTLSLTPFVIGGGTVHAILDVSGYFQ